MSDTEGSETSSNATSDFEGVSEEGQQFAHGMVEGVKEVFSEERMRTILVPFMLLRNGVYSEQQAYEAVERMFRSNVESQLIEPFLASMKALIFKIVDEDKDKKTAEDLEKLSLAEKSSDKTH